MTPRDLKNIHTTGNGCRDALPCANVAVLYPQGDSSGLRMPKKRISINTVTTSVHLLKPVSTDLTIKLDSVLTNLVGKDGDAKLVNVKHLPHKAFL